MDFAELTRTRRTVSAYTPERVDEAVVKAALELSLWAPNHRLTYPVRYLSLGPTTRANLSELAVELKGARGPLGEVQRLAVRDSVTRPSHLIALGLKRSADSAVAHEDYATLACAVQIATTFLWAHGVATKWSTAGWTRHARTYEVLGWDPARVALEGALIVGRAASVPRTPARPRLDEVFGTIV